jgi:hypothetical protein
MDCVGTRDYIELAFQQRRCQDLVDSLQPLLVLNEAQSAEGDSRVAGEFFKSDTKEPR